jgi:polysaccharide biosynthesis/export protein
MRVAIITDGRRGAAAGGGAADAGRSRGAAEYRRGGDGFRAVMASRLRYRCWSSARALRVFALAALASVVGAVLPAQVTDYRIGPQDVLSVKVYETPELNADDLRVSTEGKITLPNAGAIALAGLTEAEAGLEVERVLEQCCVNRATVTVRVKEYRFKPIAVIGAVGRPGPIASSGRLTLLDVLTAAGGVGGQHGDVVHIIRHGDNGLSDQLTVRLDDLLVRGEQRMNVPIYPGDLVNVPADVEVTVFCLGEVNHPGAVSFKSSDRMSLLTAISRAGGLTDRASYKLIIRREGAGSLVEEVPVDFKAVLAGKIPDPTLEEGDVVVVKESFF